MVSGTGAGYRVPGTGSSRLSVRYLASGTWHLAPGTRMGKADASSLHSGAMSLVVQKYGGTSVGDAGRIANVARRVAERRRSGDSVVVIVSAMGHTTDELVRLAGEVSPHHHPREMDMLLTAGERIAMALLAMAITDQGIEAMARAGVVAVLLPGTAYFLSMGRYAPARKLIERGVPVALATDCNPGSCMTESLPLVLNMACTQMRLTPAEAITGATINAAWAIGEAARVGSLEPGKQADFLILDAPNHLHLCYHFGVNQVQAVFKRGRLAAGRV